MRSCWKGRPEPALLDRPRSMTTKAKVLISMLIVSAILGVAFGGALTRWYYGKRLAEERRLRNNAVAAADTLRLVVSAKGDSIRVYARLAQTLKNEKDVADAASEEMREAARRLERDLRAVSNVAVGYRAQIDNLTRPVVFGDSTRIPVAYDDAELSVTGEQKFPGRIVPNPTPPVTTMLDVWIKRIGLEIGLAEDPDTCAPELLVRTDSPRVALLEVESYVDQRATCLDDNRPEFPIHIGSFTTGLGVGGIIAGTLYLLSR